MSDDTKFVAMVPLTPEQIAMFEDPEAMRFIEREVQREVAAALRRQFALFEARLIYGIGPDSVE